MNIEHFSKLISEAMLG